MKNINNRKTEYPINDIFLKRYSPRAMSGDEISDEELMTLFEAARWAPSSMNAQPWRFIYAMRGSEEFEIFFSFLFEGNKVWCKNASSLVVLISKKNFDNEKPSRSHSFDAGSAWENLALQAVDMHLVVHGMSGFDYEMAKKMLSVPDDYNIEMMIAIGRPGEIEKLPENLREREKPNGRKELKELISKGKFTF